MSNLESRIQQACVRWFRIQHRKIGNLLFAVPNGGKRGRVTAAILKGEGVVAGVSDLLLLYPTKKYGALCIEMKTPQGRQSKSQKEWQALVEKAGYKYVVCRSIDDFMKEVNDYLNEG